MGIENRTRRKLHSSMKTFCFVEFSKTSHLVVPYDLTMTVYHIVKSQLGLSINLSLTHMILGYYYCCKHWNHFSHSASVSHPHPFCSPPPLNVMFINVLRVSIHSSKPQNDDFQTFFIYIYSTLFSRVGISFCFVFFKLRNFCSARGGFLKLNSMSHWALTIPIPKFFSVVRE